MNKQFSNPLVHFFLICAFFSCNNETKKPLSSGEDLKSLVKLETISPEVELMDSSFYIKLDSALVFQKKGDHDTAIIHLIEAMDSPDFQLLSVTAKSNFYYYLGLSKLYSNELEKAMSSFDTCEIFANKTSTLNLSLTQVHYNRAQTLAKYGDYNGGMVAIDKAINLFKEIQSTTDSTLVTTDRMFPFSKLDVENLGLFYNTKGRLLIALEDLENAEKYLYQAEKLISEDNPYVAGLYIALKNINVRKDTPKAIQYGEKICELLKDNEKNKQVYLNTKRHLIWMKYPDLSERIEALIAFINDTEDTDEFIEIRYTTYSQIGEMYTWLGNFKDGLKYLEKSMPYGLKIYKNHKGLIVSDGYRLIGNCHSEMGNWEKASDLYDLSLETIFYGNQSDLDVFDINIEKKGIINQDALLYTLEDYSLSKYNKYLKLKDIVDLKESFELCQLLDNTISLYRKLYPNESFENSYVEDYLEFYERSIWTSLELYKVLGDDKYLNYAYDFASKNKAAILFDDLQNDDALTSKVPSSMVEKSIVYRDSISHLDNEIAKLSAINNPVDSLNLIELIDKRFNTSVSYDFFLTDMEQSFPEYYNLKYSNSEIISLEELQSKIPDQTAIIEYFIGADSIYSFLISSNTQVRYDVKEKPENFEDLCKDYRSTIEKDSVMGTMDFSSLSYNLYELLLKDQLKKLKFDSINRLMIIPDKDLLLLSLDSFFTDELKQNSTTEWTDKLPLLINDYALSYFYSNRFIYNEVLKERVAKKYIGFGLEYKDANLGKFTSQDSAEISKTTRKGFGRLLHSKNEILECSEIFDGESFINQDATVQSFIKNAPDADILHIAAHGFVSLDLPMSSGLVFSKTSKEKDNILRESNIYKMDINSEVVILSACNTANGVIHKGEGIRSLSRAFTYAGCSNVTASLWSAPDFSTKEIIVPYLKYLKEGLPKDVALQQAKLEYIDNCEFNKDALPCNWSHLISTGNQDPISFEEGWSFW